MDRTTVYYGELPRSVDFLGFQKNALFAFGRLASLFMAGNDAMVNGMECTPGTGLSVQLAPGELYTVAPLDATPWGTLPSDPTPTVQQAILYATATVSLTAPSSGTTTYYISVGLNQADTTPAVLPYLNSSNPTQPYAGPGNTNVAEPTLRQALVSIQASTNATPGEGYVNLYTVTVAAGATEIAAADISAPLVELPQIHSAAQTFEGTITQVPGAGVNNETPFAQYGDFLSDFIVEGLSVPVPSPASLTATLSTGTAVVLGQRTVVDSIPNATNVYAASSDTYVSLSQSGVVAYAAVANGATAPTPASGAVNILLIVTSSTGIAKSIPLVPTSLPSINGIVKFSEWGGDPTGSSFSDEAFYAVNEYASSKGYAIDLGGGSYKFENGLLLTTHMFGSGSGSCALNFSEGLAQNSLSTSGPQNLLLGGFSIYEYAPSSGTYGLIINQVLANCNISDITISGAYYGFEQSAGSAGGFISKIIVTKCGSHGFHIDMPNITVTDSYALQNQGYGFYFSSSKGNSGNIVFIGSTSFGNVLGDVVAQGQGVGYGLTDGIYSNITISTAASGHGFLLDTYGVRNSVFNIYAESAGESVSGVLSSENFSNFYATSNNADSIFSNIQSYGATGSGIKIECNSYVASNLYSTNDGLNGAQNDLGVNISSTDDFSISGLYARTTTAKYGVGFLGSGLTNFSLSNIRSSGTNGIAIYVADSLENGDVFGCPGVGFSNSTVPLNIPPASSPGQAATYSQLGNLNGVVAAADTETLPDTAYGQAVRVEVGNIVTLPVNNGTDGDLIFFYPSYTGGYSIASNTDQFIYAPTIGMVETTGPITLDCGQGETVLLMSRGNGEFDIIGGNILNSSLLSSIIGTTAGSINSSMSLSGPGKKFMAYANTYENNTTTAQTITFPTAFNNTPVITTNTSGLTLTVSTTELTITAPDNTTTYSGLIIVEGF